MIEIKVPAIGESISEVTLSQWLKKDGDYVERDEILCEFESEKATFELNAEQAGILTQKIAEGETVPIGAVACTIDTKAKAPEKKETSTPEESKKTESAKAKETAKEESKKDNKAAAADAKASPLAKAMMSEKKLPAQQITGTGSQGRILKQDVLNALNASGIIGGATSFIRETRREKMSNLRKTVARRLVEAKNNTAMLTTFNEVDMSRIMEIRNLHKDKFKEQYGVGLGFMSFFTKAVCYALQEFPAVNAYIDGQEIVYHEFCDISIAVSAPKGLVVPVIRNAESLSMSEIEKEVVTLAKKARDNKLTIEEMTGGTFTLTNGGVFGSLLSTPIINIPQSAILGMHKIEERPIALNGQVVIRPMMYLALSYDHRIIDGKESVSFLVRVKELLEHPEGLLVGQDPVSALLGF